MKPVLVWILIYCVVNTLFYVMFSLASGSWIPSYWDPRVIATWIMLGIAGSVILITRYEDEQK